MPALKVFNYWHHLNDQSRILQSLGYSDSMQAFTNNLNQAAREIWKFQDVECRVTTSYVINLDKRMVVTYCFKRLCESMMDKLNKVFLMNQDIDFKAGWSFYLYSRGLDKTANAETKNKNFIDENLRGCRFYCWANEDGWLVYNGSVFVRADVFYK